MKNFLLVLVFGLLVVGVATGYAHFSYSGRGDRGNGEFGSTIQTSVLVSEPAGMILLGLGLIGLAGFGKSELKMIVEHIAEIPQRYLFKPHIGPIIFPSCIFFHESNILIIVAFR